MKNALRRSDRGAVLIHVAIAILVLIGFVAFVVDYGVMWVGRRQAQNAADAGALAGAVAMAFDANGFTDRTPTGPARASAHRTALANGAWGQSPAVVVDRDVYFTGVPAAMCPPDTNGRPPCLRVDVYRDQANGNPLPSIFGLAVGITSQNMRATATARFTVGDSSDCLKPWAIPDKWLDNYDVSIPIETSPPEWTEDDAFETKDGNGGNAQPLPNPDVYRKSTPGDPGTGFTVAADHGRRVTLKQGGPGTSISPGVFQPIRLPRHDGDSTGGDDYRENIVDCNGIGVGIGDEVESENGNMIGPTKQGVLDLIAKDPNAKWDPALNSGAGGVVDSCAQAVPACAASSPRVVAVPVYDTTLYDETKRQGLPVFVVVNILGFFLEQMQGNNVVGYLTEAPGLSTSENAPIDPESSFIKVIQLIR